MLILILDNFTQTDCLYFFVKETKDAEEKINNFFKILSVVNFRG